MRWELIGKKFGHYKSLKFYMNKNLQLQNLIKTLPEKILLNKHEQT